MLGLGTLFRIVKGLLGRPLEDTGLLPTRYYVREILEALDHDNIGEAVRLLKKAKGSLIDRARLDLTRQQIIFRCRVLRERHGKRIRYLEGILKADKKNRKLPWRWLHKDPAERIGYYEKSLDLEQQAQHLLDQYEMELKDILTR
jgi:hypothetical protein